MLLLSRQLGNSVYTQFDPDVVLCPKKLGSKIFAAFTVDNKDYNPGCCSAKDSQHGTTISAMQYLELKTDEISYCSI